VQTAVLENALYRVGATGDEFMEPGGGAVARKRLGTTILNKQEIEIAAHYDVQLNIRMKKSRRMRWAGHAWERSPYKVLIGISVAEY
jgi:hypothetical protein